MEKNVMSIILGCYAIYKWCSGIMDYILNFLQEPPKPENMFFHKFRIISYKIVYAQLIYVIVYCF